MLYVAKERLPFKICHILAFCIIITIIIMYYAEYGRT